MKRSAGLLLYRHDKELDVLLVHPGGPFFARKDLGVWSIPKGEVGEGEEPLQRARVEFEEELGFAPPATDVFELGCVKQKGGKEVCAWAVEGKLPVNFALRSNCFEMEWPPRSGRTQQFAEVDDAQFFPIPVARQKINPAQVAFLVRLEQWLEKLAQEGSP
jgi:predicted NUDIX family NTP pyrophosphohydrolase